MRRERRRKSFAYLPSNRIHTYIHTYLYNIILHTFSTQIQFLTSLHPHLSSLNLPNSFNQNKKPPFHPIRGTGINLRIPPPNSFIHSFILIHFHSFSFPSFKHLNPSHPSIHFLLATKRSQGTGKKGGICGST